MKKGSIWMNKTVKLWLL